MINTFFSRSAVLIASLLAMGSVQAESMVTLTNKSFEKPYEMDAALGDAGLVLKFDRDSGSVGSPPGTIGPETPPATLQYDQTVGWTNFTVWDEGETIQYGEFTVVIANQGPEFGRSCVATFYRSTWETKSDWPPTVLGDQGSQVGSGVQRASTCNALGPPGNPNALLCAFPEELSQDSDAADNCAWVYLAHETADTVRADVDFFSPGVRGEQVSGAYDKAYSGDMCVKDNVDPGFSPVQFCCNFYNGDKDAPAVWNRPALNWWLDKPVADHDWC